MYVEKLDTKQSNNRSNVPNCGGGGDTGGPCHAEGARPTPIMGISYNWFIDNGHYLVLIYFIIQVTRYLFEWPWYDESFTVWVTKLAWPNFFDSLAGDVHPPLYYILSKFIGHGIIGARLISVCAFLISLVIFKKILHTLNMSPTIIKMALTIMLLSPYSLQYATEGRMYALLMLFCVLAVYLALNGHGGLLMLVLVGGMYTHNLFVLYIPVILVLLFTRKQHPFSIFSPVPLMAVVAFFLYWPWVPILLNQTFNVRNSFWILPLSPGRVVMLVNTIIWGSQGMLSMTVGTIINFALLTLVPNKFQHRIILFLAFGPLLIGAILSILIKPILIPRVLIGTAPFFYVLLALAVQRLCTEWGKNWASALLLPVVIAHLFFMPTLNKLPIITNVVEGGTCYHISATYLIQLRDYLNCEHVLLPTTNNLEQSLSSESKQAMGINEVYFDDVANGTVWLIWVETPYSSINEFLAVKFILVKHHPEKTYILNDSDFVDETVWLIKK